MVQYENSRLDNSPPRKDRQIQWTVGDFSTNQVMPDVMTPDSMVSKLDSLESKENEGMVTDEERDVSFFVHSVAFFLSTGGVFQKLQCSAIRVYWREAI